MSLVAAADGAAAVTSRSFVVRTNTPNFFNNYLKQKTMDNIFCPGCDTENQNDNLQCIKCKRYLQNVHLTRRERIINTLNVSMLNWSLRAISDDKKESFLYAILKTKGINAENSELIEIVNMLNQDNANAVQQNIGILGVYGKLLRPFGI